MLETAVSAYLSEVHTVSDDLLWCAYHSDFSGIALFATELQALRYCVAENMKIKRVQRGKDLLEQLR